MRPTARVLAAHSARALAGLPSYFTRGDSPADAALNTVIALRRWPETVLYHATFGRVPAYATPRTYTEKIQWRKLYDHSEELVIWSDKLAARDEARRRAPAVEVPELYWAGTDADAMPLDELEPPYVIKANNRSGAVVLVAAGTIPDRDALRAEAAGWLQRSAHRRWAYEWAYGRSSTQIIVEEFLSTDGGATPPPDLKFFVFHGKARYLYHRNTVSGELAVLSPDWKPYPWDRWARLGKVERTEFRAKPPRPRRLGDMIAIAEAIAATADHLRVDLYEVADHIYFGETTVYPSSGNKVWIRADDPADPHPAADIDRLLGSHWTVAHLDRRERLRRGLRRFG